MAPEEGRAWLADVSNVLVLDSTTATDQPPCATQFSPAPQESVGLVSVTFDGGAENPIPGAESADSPIAEQRVIAVGDAAEAARIAGGDTSVDTVDHPADLTGLGIRLGSAVEALDGPELVVCFNSLTALLEHTDVQRAFRFLHVITAQLSNTGATAHYHLDREPLDDGTLATVQPVFDTVVRSDGEEWIVRQP